MNFVYLVQHAYDQDGGFGDAVPCCDVVAAFSTEEKANDFVEKYNKPHVYDVPYSCLECGMLFVEKVSIDKDIDEKSMWWLTCDRLHKEE